MDLLRAFGASLVGALVALGFGAWLVRRWLEKAVDRHFTRLGERDKSIVALEAAPATSLIQRRNAVYPEFVDLTYRIRNILREYVDGDPRIAYKQEGVLSELLLRLTDQLYTNRAFLAPDIYDRLHSMKRLGQDAALHLNAQTREELYKSTGDVESVFRSVSAALRPLLLGFDQAYGQLVPQVQAYLDGILGERAKQLATPRVSK